MNTLKEMTTILNELLEIGKIYPVRFDAKLLIFNKPSQMNNTKMTILDKMEDIDKFKVQFDVCYGVPNYVEFLSADDIQLFIRNYKEWVLTQPPGFKEEENKMQKEILKVGEWYDIRFPASTFCDEMNWAEECECEIVSRNINGSYVVRLCGGMFGEDKETTIGEFELRDWTNAYSKKHNLGIEYSTCEEVD